MTHFYFGCTSILHFVERFPYPMVYSQDMKKIWLVLAVLVVSGCVSKPADKSKVLARFDGIVVTENDFTKKLQSLPKTVRTIVASHKKDLLNDMASEHFLLKEAKRQGLEKEEDVRDLIQAAHRKILIAKLVEREVDNKIRVEPEEITKYYEFHKEEFMTPILLRASHILVKTEEEAGSVKAALDAGADFEETARQHSLDATAIRGGDLGFFQKGQFVPEFEEAVFRMKKGEVNGPVKTPLGYHVIKLSDRMEPRLRELKVVQKIVEERLLREKRSKTFKDFVEKLKGNVNIDIDEKALDLTHE